MEEIGREALRFAFIAIALLGLYVPSALIVHELRTRRRLRNKARQAGIEPPPMGLKRLG